MNSPHWDDRVDPADIEDALRCIDPDLPREDWLRVGMALQAELGDEGFDIFDGWSATGESYNARDVRDVWRSLRGGGVGIGTLFHMAQQAGWARRRRDDAPGGATGGAPARPQRPVLRVVRDDPMPDYLDTQERARQAWELATPAPANHPYLARKEVAAHGVRVLGQAYDGAPSRVRHNGNLLVIPRHDVEGVIWSCEFINELGEKATIRGRVKPGSHYLIDGDMSRIVVCEGFATAASFREMAGCATAVAFSATNMLHVVDALLTRHARVEVLPDDDEAGGRVLAQFRAERPQVTRLKLDWTGVERQPGDSDYNDYMRRRRHG